MAKVEVTIFNILQYIGERSRPLKEGEAVFRAGHIILCGLEEGSSNIKSLCLQTSSLTSSPHEITLTLHEDVKQWLCLCTCKAGMSGFCKHIVATLMYINRHEVLELVSCTDLEQKWGKEKKVVEETYQAKPFKQFCHPTTKKKYNFKTSQEQNDYNFALLSTGVAESALTKFLSRSLIEEKVIFKSSAELDKQNFAVLSAGESHSANKVSESDSEISGTQNRNIFKIFEHIENSEFLKQFEEDLDLDNFNLKPCCKEVVNSLACVNVLQVAQFEQGSPSWAKERKLRITGSNCYSIYTFKKTEDWETKRKKFFFPKHFTNKFKELGKTYESEAQELYSKRNDCQVITLGLVVYKTMPWLGFSPDGVAFENGVPTRLLEIKCPFSGKTEPASNFLETCSYLESEGEILKLKKKHIYYGQVQLGMALLNINEADLFIYSSFSKSYLQVNVPFDKDFAKDLISEVSNKYFNNMLHFYCLNKD